MNKKGMKSLSVDSVVTGLLVIVIAFKVFAMMLPKVAESGQEIADTGYEGTDFFSADDGILIFLLVIGIFLLVLKQLGFIGTKKRK